jgi:hypothetical protein
MAKKPSLDEFNQHMANIAAMLIPFVNAEIKDKHWKLAYLDSRSAGPGAQFKKLRVELSDGTVCSSLSTPMDATMTLHKALRIKDKVFDRKWHGIKLIVRPDGKYETQFNYDPDCASDPQFLQA